MKRCAAPAASTSRRRRAVAYIETLSDQIGIEREKQSQIAGLKSQITQKEALIADYIKSRDKLVTAGSAERVARLETKRQLWRSGLFFSQRGRVRTG